MSQCLFKGVLYTLRCEPRPRDAAAAPAPSAASLAPALPAAHLKSLPLPAPSPAVPPTCRYLYLINLTLRSRFDVFHCEACTHVLLRGVTGAACRQELCGKCAAAAAVGALLLMPLPSII